MIDVTMPPQATGGAVEPTYVRLTIPESVDPALVLGPADALLKRIESAFDAMVSVRGDTVTVVGAPEVATQVTSVFSQLVSAVEAGEAPNAADVDLIIGRVSHGAERPVSLDDDILLTYRGRALRAKTLGQQRYVRSIRANTITFGLGPAGTGKTYLAMAMAVAALKRREIARIVLTRPVVEAGESLGYLPGTLEEKLDPYVRPLMDALFDMSDIEKATTMIEQGVVEIAPLAFMRGRTLNNAFVILDEAQNTTPEQMKMFLTRLGYSSTFVVTGDTTQRDLTGRDGISHARAVLEGVEGIGFVDLDRNDIVRHSLVARIVDAYAAADDEGKGGGHADAR